jgi:hypothetical protein
MKLVRRQAVGNKPCQRKIRCLLSDELYANYQAFEAANTYGDYNNRRTAAKNPDFLLRSAKQAILIQS